MPICPSCDHPAASDALECAVCGEKRAEQGWPQDPWLGQTLGGKYLLEARIGVGSHGIVFSARHREDELDLGKVALKLLRSARRDRAARFLREAQSARAVHSPHALSVHAVGHTDDGLPYVVTPLLVGETLAERLERGPLKREVARRIARAVCDALAAIHEAGLVHRDVKPANVFLGNKDFVTLLDFGIARSEQELAEGVATIAGTPAYMAPEHRACEPIDGRADIYALGVMLHEMIEGRRPLGEDDVSVQGADGALVSRCLALLPEERPSAAQLGRLLDEGSETPPTRTATLEGASRATARAGAQETDAARDAEPVAPPAEQAPAWRPFLLASLVFGATALALWSFDRVGEVARDTSVAAPPPIETPAPPEPAPAATPPSTQEVIEARAAAEAEAEDALLEDPSEPSATSDEEPRAGRAPRETSPAEEIEVPLVWRRVIDAPRLRRTEAP